jgi:hypothetical protein
LSKSEKTRMSFRLPGIRADPVANPKRPDQQDDLKLRASGFNPEAPPADSLARIRELRKSGALDAIAIARALANVADRGAAEMLAEMEQTASGALRREIRRSLFRLSRRGIVPAESAVPSAAGQKTASAAPSEPGLSAFVSPIDPGGAQIVWLVKPRHGSGLVRLSGLVSEDEGLVSAGVEALTRREFRAHRSEIERRAGMKLVEADPGLADFILCDAYRRTPESRRGAIGNFYALRAEVTGAARPDQFAHPVYSELSAEMAEEPSVDLLKEPEIEAWRIPAADLGPYLEELNRTQESVIVVSAASQQERAAAALEKAIVELLSGDRLARLRRRLEHTAYYMMKDGRRRAAGWAAGAAAMIRDGADLRRVGFFRALVERQLAAVIVEQSEHRHAEPRLIMTPAEAIRAQEERRSRARGRR